MERGFATGALGSVLEDLREPVKRATVAVVEAIVSAARFADCLCGFAFSCGPRHCVTYGLKVCRILENGRIAHEFRPVALRLICLYK